MKHPFHEIPDSGIPYWNDLHVYSKSRDTSIASSTVSEQNSSLESLNKTSIKIITKMNETIKNKTLTRTTVNEHWELSGLWQATSVLVSRVRDSLLTPPSVLIRKNICIHLEYCWTVF